jgi:methionyl-tRNA formyltransferase
MLRVVFFGNSEGPFSNRHFAALEGAPCELAAVIDVPPSQRTSTNARSADGRSFVEYARDRGIPAFEPARPNSPEFVATIRDLRPDLFLAVGYLNRLREGLLLAPRLLAANFHASLLPEYRGLHPVFRTLRRGERWAGLTVHVIDPGLDTGDILYQVRVRTRRNDSVGSLYDRIMRRSVGLVGRLIADAGMGRLHRRPQPAGKGSYFSSVSDEDFRLDLGRPAEQLRRWICTTPGRCFFESAGGRVFVLDAEVARGTGARPGELIRLGRSRCTVAVGSAGLNLGKVQTEAGVQNASDWCRNHGLKVGERIECHSPHCAN